MRSLMTPLTPEFVFAGFTWPRYFGTLPRGSLSKRIARAKNPVCGPYYGAPTPNSNNGTTFYLGSDFQPFSRWEWCDEVDSHIRHTGWFCDDYQDSKIRGLVARLPHGRFLAGWSMGEGMASFVDATWFDDAVEAARAADDMARYAAEREREYRESDEE